MNTDEINDEFIDEFTYEFIDEFTDKLTDEFTAKFTDTYWYSLCYSLSPSILIDLGTENQWSTKILNVMLQYWLQRPWLVYCTLN